MAADGESLDGPEAGQREARRFVGWSNERHWLLQNGR